MDDNLNKVYVDTATLPYGRMTMCHMASDNLDLLHAMADKIGVKRQWFQNKSKRPHYDICKAKRKLAIENGAIEVSSRELVSLLCNSF